MAAELNAEATLHHGKQYQQLTRIVTDPATCQLKVASEQIALVAAIKHIWQQVDHFIGHVQETDRRQTYLLRRSF